MLDRTRRLRTLCLMRKDEEYGGGGHQEVADIEVRNWYERAAYQERVQRQLGHLRVVREVSVVRVVAPALPESPEHQERANEHPHVETEAEQTVLPEELEVDAVGVVRAPVARTIVDGPNIRGRERLEPSPCEWSADRDVPGGLEGLNPARRGLVACGCRLLLGDGFEANPESLGRQRRGDDPDHERGGRETQAPR